MFEKLEFVILNQITDNLPTFPINKALLKIPCNINLADDTFDIPGPIYRGSHRVSEAAFVFKLHRASRAFLTSR